MYVSDVMSSPVTCVHEDSRLPDVIRLLLEQNISGVPVTDESGRLLGILTEGDLMERAEIGTEKDHASWLSWLVSDAQRARDYFLSHAQKVGDIMTKDVFCVSPTTPLAKAIALIEKNHIKRVPVVQDGKVIGILARADILRAVLKQFKTTTDLTDAEICRRVEEEVRKQPWAPSDAINVTVKDGVVEFRGMITDRRFHDALRVLAENVPGVTSVRDYLAWIEPWSGVVLSPGGAA